MRKPVIAVTSSKKEIPDLPFEYIQYSASHAEVGVLMERGALTVIPPFLSDEDADRLMAGLDGLFVTGGADVNPALYGEEKLPECGDIEPDRDASDLALIKAALKHKKPVLAVCRGSQLCTVHFGGSLYQDLPTQLGDKIKHTDLYNTTKEDSHTVNIVPGTPLHNLLGKDVLGVNSTHHQGFKTLGPDSIPMAYAPDGLCESWYSEKDGTWIRVYQWHPEMMDFNDNMDKILCDFVNECKNRMK
ncbi:MAG: gamma-glutamyl-gamma-aminobutyrate hydrolase family protein [Oscillospiraceae bacterium]|nr:gamma-glutamyl-gamma-aminobutyrate hydrolase family protein [Oscillospiraceae bacterium]